MSEDEMRAIAMRIAERRKELGMSYQDLADATGMSKSTLQRYETGDIKNIPLHKLRTLASGLHTSPSELMGWGDDNVAAGYEPDSADALRDRVFAKSPALFKMLDKATPEELQQIEKIVGAITEE